MNEGNGNFGILIEVWMRGFVNVDTLANRITLSFKQTLCEYLIELVCLSFLFLYFFFFSQGFFFQKKGL